MIELNSEEQKLWWTSDTHFYHKNITKGESKWNSDRGVRNFDTSDQMTDALICGINKYVKKDDILFHLGDWSFDGIDKIWEARRKIICKNIYLIAGNHDLKIIRNDVLPSCQWESEWGRDQSAGLIYRIKTVGSSSKEVDIENQVTAQNLFYYLGTSDLIQIDKYLVYMSHFPCEGVRYDKRSFHIHGHVHGTYPPSRSRLDVGIDNAFKLFGEYRPFSWGEICKILK